MILSFLKTGGEQNVYFQVPVNIGKDPDQTFFAEFSNVVPGKVERQRNNVVGYGLFYNKPR